MKTTLLSKNINPEWFTVTVWYEPISVTVIPFTKTRHVNGFTLRFITYSWSPTSDGYTRVMPVVRHSTQCDVSRVKRTVLAPPLARSRPPTPVRLQPPAAPRQPPPIGRRTRWSPTLTSRFDPPPSPDDPPPQYIRWPSTSRRRFRAPLPLLSDPTCSPRSLDRHRYITSNHTRTAYHALILIRRWRCQHHRHVDRRVRRNAGGVEGGDTRRQRRRLR